MNFFGHLTVASFERDAEGYLLGSMLPDFAGMCQQRLHGADSADIEAGIRFHHFTDRVFHANVLFVAWCADGTRHLLEAGVRKGTASAVAHVAPELLLDAWLSERFDADDDYARALASGAPARLGGRLRWAKEEGASRFEFLRQQLLMHGSPRAARDPEVFLMRVMRTLERRPRLAVSELDKKAVGRYLDALPSRIDAEADALLVGLRRELEAGADGGERP